MKRELRVGMSLYWLDLQPETLNGVEGHRWSGSGGKVGGWTAGNVSESLREAREAYVAREALHRIAGVAPASPPRFLIEVLVIMSFAGTTPSRDWVAAEEDGKPAIYDTRDEAETTARFAFDSDEISWRVVEVQS